MPRKKGGLTMQRISRVVVVLILTDDAVVIIVWI